MPKLVDVEQRRSELTDAAARVIARSGIEAATMREVAAEAGWTTGALTHYFTDTRTLLLATFEGSLAKRRSRRPSSADATAAERLRSSIEGALPLDAERRRHWLVTLTCCTQAAHDTVLAAAQRDAYREFRDHVVTLVDEAGLARGRHALALAERLIATADGIAIQALFDPASWPAQRQRATLDQTLRPLGV
jgi:TetR/AcrR family transcriptional regulator, transcriptional repressor of bet genes